MQPTTRVTFLAGDAGEWEVSASRAIKGAGLPDAPRLARLEGAAATPIGAARWALDGVRSHERYTSAMERRRMAAVQEGLGRAASTLAALIPITKSAAWWKLAQDERRALFEETSRHIAIGLEYLPAIARRLYHCRDLGGEFDFLTWFEYAPGDADRFDELLARLRATPEWSYVEREVEVRVFRSTG
ncbi:MAG: chlorite dismutase family protein [Kofleriaceae bacterium]|nr:chlorite dismutase family protein [Kofleriaceae bacterium]